MRAVDLLDKLVDSLDLTLHQVVHEKEFLSSLEKVLTRETSSPQLVMKVKGLFTKWVTQFSADQDILPNFSTFHSRLVEQGLIEPVHQQAGLPVMDSHLLNEAEGQDPDEFKAEVTETIKLFDEVYGVITGGTKLSRTDEVSRREALISLAANLDRYSEQFGLWIEQLEPGTYMEEAMTLNDKVTDALQRYKVLRSSSLKKTKASSESSESDDSSDDESSDED